MTFFDILFNLFITSHFLSLTRLLFYQNYFNFLSCKITCSLIGLFTHAEAFWSNINIWKFYSVINMANFRIIPLFFDIYSKVHLLRVFIRTFSFIHSYCSFIYELRFFVLFYFSSHLIVIHIYVLISFVWRFVHCLLVLVTGNLWNYDTYKGMEVLSIDKS